MGEWSSIRERFKLYAGLATFIRPQEKGINVEEKLRLLDEIEKQINPPRRVIKIRARNVN